MRQVYEDPYRPSGSEQYANPGVPVTFGSSAWDALGSQPAATPRASASSPFFDDPLSQPIMTAWTRRMSQLSTPGPDYGDIEGMFGAAVRPDPRFDDAIRTLQASMKRSAPSNAYLGQYAANTRRRIDELNAEPFDAQEEARLKARFFDDLARSRDDRQEQLRARLATMGYAPTSGVAAEAATLLEGDYEQGRAQQQRELLQYVTDERNRRRDLGVQMSGALSGAGAQEAANQASFEGQRAGIAGNLAQLMAALQDRRLGVASTIANLRRQRYLDDLDRGGLELETSALPASLAQQRMAQLQAVLSGFAPNAANLYEQQLSREQLAQQEQARSDQNRAALWGTIGSIATPLISGLLNRGD